MRRILPALGIPLAYLALTVLMTWPLAARMGVSLNSWGDPQLQSWVLAWNAHALQTDPASIWQAPIFYPYPDTLAFSDNHLLLSLIAAPIISVSRNPVLAYNVLVLLSFVLTGWAVYSLAMDTVHERWAAFIAGAAFAFCSYRMAQSFHLQLLQTAWLPWALLYLRRLLAPSQLGGGRMRHAIGLGLFTAIQCTTALYYAFFAGAVLGGYVLLWWLSALWQRIRYRRPLPWSTIGKLLVAAAVTAAILTPLTLPYLRVYSTLGITRSARELETWSAPLQSYLTVESNNLLYGRLGAPFTTGTGEWALFPGLLITLCALGALLRRPGRDQLFWGLVAAGAFVLSLGVALRIQRYGTPLPVPLPYGLLYGRVPGFAALRVPARWGMLVPLAFAMLAALALGPTLRRLHGRGLPLAGPLILLVVLLEQVSLPLRTTDPAALLEVAPVYRWLGAPEQAELKVVLELPVGPIPREDNLDLITWRQFNQRYHWKALPVAFSGIIPFGTTDLLAEVQRLPGDEALHYLQIAGVDTLVVHRDEYEPGELDTLLDAFDRSPRVRHHADLGQARVYRLLPETTVAALKAGTELPQSIYVAADERMPGLLALALVRRWKEQGFALYGPGRPKYYAAIRQPRPGQVHTYGLLPAGEDPLPYGFERPGLQWESHGLALYAGSPDLRANLDLALYDPNAAHPSFPSSVDLTLQNNGGRIAGAVVTWGEHITEGRLEIDVASLAAQSIKIGAELVPVPAGVTTVTANVPLDQPLEIAGEWQTTALRRLRVRSAPASETPAQPQALAVRATTSFSGTHMTVEVEAAGMGELLLDVEGAAARDERPVRLLSGSQPALPQGGALTFDVDLLAPDAPWIASREEAVDGRYIAYLKLAANPDAPGLPVATFSIHGGELADPRPVPLPLTALR